MRRWYFLVCLQVRIFKLNSDCRTELGRIGFLADLDKKNFQLKIKDILDGNYIIDKRTLLSGSIISGDKKYNSIALNDIVINNRGTLKMIEMNIYVNEVSLQNKDLMALLLQLQLDQLLM